MLRVKVLFTQTMEKEKSYCNECPTTCVSTIFSYSFKFINSCNFFLSTNDRTAVAKFEAVQTVLENELAGKNVAEWSKPEGGYFVSVNTLEGCATAVIDRAAKAGVKLTPAGSTYPYKKDPLDRNIRLAPTFPPLEDIHQALELVSICIQLVSIDKLLGD